MAGDQETVTVAAAVAAGGDLVPRAGARPLGPAAIAAELRAHAREANRINCPHIIKPDKSGIYNDYPVNFVQHFPLNLRGLFLPRTIPHIFAMDFFPGLAVLRCVMT